MIIRKLQGEERFDASLISGYCFHARIQDLEKEREKALLGMEDDWGAFTEDGTLMAHIIDTRFPFFVDGTVVCSGGIGAVSTLPEYRNQGAVRAVFRELLPAAYRDGEVISVLYPFNHGFYRKQGYETVVHQNVYTLKPAFLSSFRFDGTVTRWNPGESAAPFLEIYSSFARNYNLAMDRDEKCMLSHIKCDNLYLDRKFTYLLEKDGTGLSYVTFTDIRHDPQAVLRVDECAWTCREGFRAILAFLARFDADYGTVELPLPAGIDLLRILHSPQAYDVVKTSRQNAMVRVINAEKLLDVIHKPAACDFLIRVHDELIPENNGIWRVTSDGVISCEEDSIPEPDLDVSEKALAQLCVGAVNLDEAMLRDDVKVLHKERMLRGVFAEKKIYISEQF